MKLIRKREVLAYHRMGAREIHINGDEIITAEARDFARKLGIRFSRRPQDPTWETPPEK